MKYITTPIYYLNDKPHIGHAYTTIAADILTNYFEKKGEEVFFLTGTDEHGQKNAKSAEEKDITPKEFVDQQSKLYQNAWKKLKIGNDFFIRTTDQAHKNYVKEFLTDLYRKEEIYKGKYEGFYCPDCEAYLKKEDLKQNCCPVHEKLVERIKEEVYFFKLSHYQRKLIEAIEDEEMEIAPEKRKNEVLSFLKNNHLEDVAITRSKVDWGIEVPWDKNQTVYVWVDALLNYLSALEINDKKEAWPACTHFMAKDILRFHGIIWPALLMASGKPLPKRLFVHGYFTISGEKMSKTKGNVINPVKLADKYPLSAIRYYLFRAFPFGDDGDFDEKKLVKMYNSQLANDLGNLVQRTLKMVNKYDVKVDEKFFEFEKDREYNQMMEELEYYDALKKIHKKVNDLNKFIEKKKPWEIYKTAKTAKEFALDSERRSEFNSIFRHLFQNLAQIAHLIYPFMPEKSRDLEKQLKEKKPEPLFPKIE